MLLAGCSDIEETQSYMESSSTEVKEELLASDTAVVLQTDLDKKTIILQTAGSGRRYEVNYDGRTYFYNKYNEQITADFLEAGDIVNVSVSVHSAYLSELKLEKNIFMVQQKQEHLINENRNLFSVDKDNYKLSQRLLVLVDGQISDISAVNTDDIVTIKGIDRTVLVCIVEQGNGTLSLKGEAPFVGGWIEIGDIIKPIEEKMELSVPEGEYDMRISYHGRSSGKHVKIIRKEETRVDISDLKDSIIKSGMITFMIAPSDARLYINGEERDYLLPIELEYGVYRMTVTARGYDTISQYLSVHKDAEEVEITLQAEGVEGDKDKEKSRTSSASYKDGNIDYVVPQKTDSESEVGDSSSMSESSSGKTDSESGSIKSDNALSMSSSTAGDGAADNSDAAEVSESKGIIYIDKPKKTEVYFDGDYKGISPISFKKIPGSHVITLRRDGYKPKSYTVNIEDNDEDQNFEFGKLKEEDE